MANIEVFAHYFFIHGVISYYIFSFIVILEWETVKDGSLKRAAPAPRTRDSRYVTVPPSTLNQVGNSSIKSLLQHTHTRGEGIKVRAS